MALRPYLRLARMPTLAFTIVVFWWGYFAARVDAGLPLSGLALDPVFWGLAAAGAFTHIFGCVHNDLCDRDIDERPGYVSAKPLQAGQVTVAAARSFALVSAAAGLICAGATAWVSDISVLFLTAGAFAFGAAYNRYGKRVLFGEFLFGACMALATFAGAASVGGMPAAFSGSPLSFGVLSFLSLAFSVVLAGGVKDMEDDEASGLHTVVAWLRRAGKGSAKPLRFVSAGEIAMQAAIFAVAALSLVFVFPPGAAQGYLAIQLVLVAALVGARVAVFERALALNERRPRVRLLALNEALQLPIFVVLLAGSMTLEVLLLVLALPIVWAVIWNRAIFQMIAAPDV